MTSNKSLSIKERFRGYLPVIVDIETSGVDPHQHALLEISQVLLTLDEAGDYHPEKTYFEHVIPFEGAAFDPKSLAFNQIDPHQALRFAIDEKTALKQLFEPIFKALKQHHCQRAVLVGHNAWFDLLFLKEAIRRTKVKSPFHAFTCFDTASLAGLIYGQTVLAKALEAANIPFDSKEAHSAIYDAEKTAELFCKMVNTWRELNEKAEKLSSKQEKN